MTPRIFVQSLLLCLFLSHSSFAQNFPDQHYVLRGDSLYQNIETIDGMVFSDDSACVMLQHDRTDGYVILKPRYSQYPFNQGLPSWNGSAPGANSSFRIQMRFPSGAGWSPWLTVGYWNAYIWTSYGSTSYTGGNIDIDHVKLNSYVNAWQFKIAMTRAAVEDSSPTVHKLSFFVSDSRTTSSLDFNYILNDNPAAIFIPTDFIYQYGVDPQIGGSICSPTSVAMILRSYNIPVDPLRFAEDTYDPYYGIFGVWPRVVQNAAEYGLNGAVTRYRSWSQAREVLANGGRISMSVGLPLYAGHLMMLAGFTAGGSPIVHDPARSNGYGYLFNKTDLSHSWFDKGGVAYTFFPSQTGTVSVAGSPPEEISAEEFRLYQNYPNPFNPNSEIRYQISEFRYVRLAVYDLLGREVAVLVDDEKEPGSYTVQFSAKGGSASGGDASDLPSGVYFYKLTAGRSTSVKKMMVLK